MVQQNTLDLLGDIADICDLLGLEFVSWALVHEKLKGWLFESPAGLTGGARVILISFVTR